MDNSNSMYFSVDATLIRRLGRELVARQETALAELIKNAYDADATEVAVEFSALGTKHSAMRIEDNGQGMNYDDLVNGFMRLATDAKVSAPISEGFGRVRAGKKGIGRFAVERLGDQLELRTYKEGNDSTLQLDVDWSLFVSGEDLAAVPSTVSRAPAAEAPGTRVAIRSLHDDWTSAQIKRVFRYVQSLLDPIGASHSGGSDDPGFTVRFWVSGEEFSDSEAVADVQSEILDYALARIDAHIDETGSVQWRIDDRTGAFSEGWQYLNDAKGQPRRASYLRKCVLSVNYFVLGKDMLPRNAYRPVREFLSRNGGIRVYRNGHRVPPYGEPDDDWLQLDEIYSRRSTNLAPIANRNFFGHVSISDMEGKIIDETASREHLIENDALDELVDLVQGVLLTAANRIAHKRGAIGKRSRTASSAKKETNETVREFNRLVSRFESAVSDAVARKSWKELTEDVNDELLGELRSRSRELVSFARERDELLQEIELLRILATMGLAAGEFTHEFLQYSHTVLLDLEGLAEVLPRDNDQQRRYIDRLEKQISVLQAYVWQFGILRARNASRMLESVNLNTTVNEFVESVRPLCQEFNTAIEANTETAGPLDTKEIHRSQLASILLNLVTNAIKAVGRVGSSGNIALHTGALEDGNLYIDVSDTGDGVPSADRKRIFEAFFTSAGQSARSDMEESQAVGTGLGLKIVNDVVAGIGGKIEVISPRPDFSTTFRVMIPRYMQQDG